MGHTPIYEYLQTLRRRYKVKRREAPPSQPTDLLLRSSQVGRLLRLRQLAFGICNLSETNVRKTSDTTKKELDKLLFELNELDLLHEDRRIEVMPHLSDYLDLGVEVIAEKIEITDEPDEEETEAEDAFEKSA